MPIVGDEPKEPEPDPPKVELPKTELHKEVVEQLVRKLWSSYILMKWSYTKKLWSSW
jgi:hypothetical protein